MEKPRSRQTRLFASLQDRLPLEARLLLVSISLVSLAGLVAVELSSF